MKQKLIIMLLTACMALSCTFALAGCNDTPTADNGGTPYPDENASQGLEFALNDDSVSYAAAGIGTCTDADIIIPSRYNDLPVTAIRRQAFEGCTSITSVMMPGSIRSIGSDAFRGCINLTSVTIPDGVTSIGDYAFAYADNLASITLPDSITSIGMLMCTETAFFNNEANWENDVLYIGNHLVQSYSDASEYTIRSGTKTIGDYAFYSCWNLTSVTIPDGVTSIGNLAFSECGSLTSITLPDSVARIGSRAFAASNNLASIAIPDGVTDIQDSAFYGTALYNDESNWENGLLYLGNHLIRAREGLSGTIEIKPGTGTIAEYAFYLCRSITDIAIPESVTSIGRAAFAGCNDLTSIAIPDGVTSIEDETFEGCRELTSLSIPDSVTSIGDEAFAGCGFTDFVIPDGVTSVGSSVFYFCENLTSVTFSENVTNIGAHLFLECYNLDSVTFENTSGWTVQLEGQTTDGTPVDVSDPAENEEYFASTYNEYIWVRLA